MPTGGTTVIDTSISDGRKLSIRIIMVDYEDLLDLTSYSRDQTSHVLNSYRPLRGMLSIYFYLTITHG